MVLRLVGLFITLLLMVVACIAVVAAWKGVSLKELMKAFLRTKEEFKRDARAAKEEVAEEYKEKE